MESSSNEFLSTIKEDSLEAEEIMIMSSVDEIKKLFVKDYLIIWHDPNADSFENTQNVNELQNISNIKIFPNWKEASSHIEGIQHISCHVITSETNGKLLVQAISDMPNVSSIYVFCQNTEYSLQWAKETTKVVWIGENFQELKHKMNKNI